jgi:hypothetical protein
MRNNSYRAVGTVTAAAIALTAAGVAPAFAVPKAPSIKPIETSAMNTDISSRRYYRGYRHRGHVYRGHVYRGHAYRNAAVAAAIIGGIGTYAAARQYRRYHYGYGEPYGYYGYGGPVLDCGPGMNSDGHGNCVPISWRYRY